MIRQSARTGRTCSTSSIHREVIHAHGQSGSNQNCTSSGPCGSAGMFPSSQAGKSLRPEPTRGPPIRHTAPGGRPRLDRSRAWDHVGCATLFVPVLTWKTGRVRTYGHRFDVNCSILFTELPLVERAAAAKAAGFSGVEFWWPWEAMAPSDAEADAFVPSIGDAGVELVSLNFHTGDMAAGERGIVSHPARVGRVQGECRRVRRDRPADGVPRLNAPYGLRVPGADPSRRTPSRSRTWRSRRRPRGKSARPCSSRPSTPWTFPGFPSTPAPAPWR